jgi:hypothetical protein
MTQWYSRTDGGTEPSSSTRRAGGSLDLSRQRVMRHGDDASGDRPSRDDACLDIDPDACCFAAQLRCFTRPLVAGASGPPKVRTRSTGRGEIAERVANQESQVVEKQRDVCAVSLHGPACASSRRCSRPARRGETPQRVALL